MTMKQYNKIIESWNPSMVLYILYKTKHSSGKMTMSIAFFLEMYKKITRLLKNVKILEIYVKNEISGIVVHQLCDLTDAWFYAIGDSYERYIN